MTLPASGPISFNDINVELGVAGTTQASLGQASYRTLAGVPSGAISMNNFYGKSNEFAFTISSNQTNADLRTLAVSAGWDQASRVVATINSGVYISSNGTGTPALTVSGSFPGGVQLVNNGFIVGMGGNGGGGSGVNYPTSQAGSAGSAGGTALSASVALTVQNNNTIAGGGGGGGGGKGGAYFEADPYDAGSVAGGGGGGGGRSSNAANTSGGAGGTVYWPVTVQGTKAPGSAGNSGTVSSAGSGGVGGTTGTGAGNFTAGSGGNGGDWGAGGSTGATSVANTYTVGPYSGGAAGNAVSGNSNITWATTGTRLGGIA